MYVCLCVYVCMCVYACVCVCVLNSERNGDNHHCLERLKEKKKMQVRAENQTRDLPTEMKVVTVQSRELKPVRLTN